jgi:hypothetical protein
MVRRVTPRAVLAGEKQRARSDAPYRCVRALSHRSVRFAAVCCALMFLIALPLHSQICPPAQTRE